MAGKTGIDFLDDRLISGWFQVADDALQIGLAHPGHHGSEINARLEVSGRKSRPELVKPEVIRV